MIINEVFKRPIISFGLGMTMLSCEVGDDVTVWQNEVYNGDEYSLEQSEIDEVITFTYSTLASPLSEFTADFSIQPTNYNGRPYYQNDTDFVGILSIYWNLTEWRIVTDLDISDGTFTDVVGRITTNPPRPVSNAWQNFGPTYTLIVPRTTTSNINVQGFTFQAVESKSIQVEVKQKGKPNASKSNTIQLIVNSSSS